MLLAMAVPPLLYLDADAVRAAMPPVDQRIELARRTMIALVEDAELPAKIGVHPRQTDAFTAAMPALLRGPDPAGKADLLGIKWVLAYPANRDRGVPAIHATVILNDGVTGQPTAILDGGPITAQRTAAVSGVALAAWWPEPGQGKGKVALIGAGVQGRSHVEVLAHVVAGAGVAGAAGAAGAALTVADRHAERAAALANVARESGHFGHVDSTTDAVAAVSGANVVLTMVSFGPQRQTIPAAALSAARLVVAIDYDMCVPADFASGAARFVVDEVEQFNAARSGEAFAGYPDPDASIGAALLGRAPAPRPAGPTYVNHLGVGLSDVVFADAIVRRAQELGIGIELPR
jgi:ornithine cyclodeaminase/alanine dehydrogenase-like protein (mu-crystallin family)